MTTPTNSRSGALAPIAFVSQHDGSRWIEVLAQAMPYERIVDDNALSDAEALLVEIAIVADPSPERMARYPHLKWIHSVWAGIERLVALAAARQLPLVRLVDPALANTMAEAVLAWTLYIHRDMPAYAAQQRERMWRPRNYVPAGEITVGILGLGELGRAAAARLVAAGYRVTGWSHSAKAIRAVETFTGATGLHTVLATADIVVVLLPLTSDTHHVLNAERIAVMREGASVINFARGAVVDTDALLRALDADKLSHAVLDVFEAEPLPTNSALWNHPKITVLPHISAPTNRDSAAIIVASNVTRFRATGELPALVRVERGY
ncbi:MAG: 2-hydroxyacid dehydrogenase [Burkholderiales bacterium]